MAILIQKNLNAMGGIPLESLYLRIQYTGDLSGKSLSSNLFPYYSKDSFKLNPLGNVLHLDGLKNQYYFDYNPNIDGDPLIFIHEKIKYELSTDLYRETMVIDPSTGEQVVENILVKAKFADASEISFVDLD